MDDHVHTGDIFNYTWYVTDRTAPAPQDGSSVMWMYHSHTHEIQDSYAGLMGAIIVVDPVSLSTQMLQIQPMLLQLFVP